MAVLTLSRATAEAEPCFRPGKGLHDPHSFRVNPHTGALSLTHAAFFYVSADCTGPPLTFASYGPRQAALRSTNPADTDLYSMTAGASARITAQSLRSTGSCIVGPRTEELAPVRAILAQDPPAPLVGPLRYVPAG